MMIDISTVTITTISLLLLLLLSSLSSPLLFTKKAGKALFEVVPNKGTSEL